MSIVTDTYNKILDGIQSLRNAAESIESTIDTTTAIVKGIYNFLEPIFSFLPWEVILLLFATILFVSWLNAVFPTTPKLNYTIVVLLLCWAWAYTEGVAYPEEGPSYGRIFRAIAYLLIPVHGIGILAYLGNYAYRTYKERKKTNPEDLEKFISTFQIESHRLQSLTHSLLAGESRTEEWEACLTDMETLIGNLKKKQMDS